MLLSRQAYRQLLPRHTCVISVSDAPLIAFQDRMHQFAWVEEVCVRPSPHESEAIFFTSFHLSIR
jgi:hypothetical protein